MNGLLPAATLAFAWLVIVAGLVAARSRPAAEQRFDADDGLELGRACVPSPLRLLDTSVRRTGPRLLAALGPRRRQRVAHRLEAAGRPLTLQSYAERQARSVFVGTGVGLALAVVSANLTLVPVGALGAWLWNDLRLNALARRRQSRLDRDLPDLLDILAVVVAAGLGFRTALARVGETLGGPLGEELSLALRQMDLGASRRDALRNLVDRSDSAQLAMFVSALLQAEELGTPLSGALAAIATDLRREFRQTARRKAAQAAPRVSLIATTLIVPGAMVLILAGLFLSSDLDAGSLLG